MGPHKRRAKRLADPESVLLVQLVPFENTAHFSSHAQQVDRTTPARKFPFLRYGVVQLQISIPMSAWDVPAKLRLARHTKHPFQSCTDSFRQVSQTKLSIKGGVEGFVANWYSGWLHESWLKVGLVSETQNTLVLGGKISQQSRIQDQRMVTVVRYIFLLQA